MVPAVKYTVANSGRVLFSGEASSIAAVLDLGLKVDRGVSYTIRCGAEWATVLGSEFRAPSVVSTLGTLVADVIEDTHWFVDWSEVCKDPIFHEIEKAFVGISEYTRGVRYLICRPGGRVSCRGADGAAHNLPFLVDTVWAKQPGKAPRKSRTWSHPWNSVSRIITTVLASNAGFGSYSSSVHFQTDSFGNVLATAFDERRERRVQVLCT